jgi:hypothetical protein
VIRQTLLWTALPNGYAPDGQRRLSVLVSPRLETDELIAGNTTPVLDQFGDLLVWPRKEIAFDVRVRIGAATHSLPAVRVSAAPDASLWEALFGPATYVRPHQFDKLDDRVVRSYPQTQVMRFLQEQYRGLAIATPTRFPGTQQLASPQSFGAIAFDWRLRGVFPRIEAFPSDRDGPLRAKLDKQLKASNAIPPEKQPNPEMDFLQVKIFHEPHNRRRAQNPAESPQWPQYERATIEKPEIDFHQMLSILGHYPELMRRLGLIIDLELDAPQGINVANADSVRVAPVWQAGTRDHPAIATTNVTPRTRLTRAFRARPGALGAALTDGQLKLDDPAAYDVLQVDVDGAALKAMNFASNLLRSLSSRHRTADTPDTMSVPALRSAGLALVQIGRASQLVHALARSSANNVAVGANNVTLFAEDVTRGFRIDIWDNTWHSLCERIGRYEFQASGITLDNISDEGYVSLGVTEAADKSLPDLYLPEAVLRWSGWSLCVPRPGTRLNADNQPEAHEPDPDTPFKLVTSFRVPAGSLPRLRFGRHYRMRARVVDLAGNGPTLDDAADQPATSTRTYLRFEPVPGPAVVLRDSIAASPGESPERLVIRSFNDAPSKDHDPTTEVSERHIVPPLGAQSLAEAHGRFDDAGGLRKDAYTTITRREGTLEDTTLVEFTTGAVVDISGPNGVEIVEKVDGGKTVYRYPVHHEGQLVLPYLPDPLARGVSFLGLPRHDVDHPPFLGLPGAPLNLETAWQPDGTAEKIDLTAQEKPPITLIRVAFGSDEDWPRWQAFRLRVEGIVEPASGVTWPEPSWDAAARVLTVFLPQAEMARVRMSAFIDPDDLATLGIWSWIEEAGLAKKQQDRLAYYAAQGRHWMMTPYRDLMLVHAVQQPLRAPKFQVLTAARPIGATQATLTVQLDAHVKSTGKVDLLARWTDPRDDLSDATPLHVEPKIITGEAHAFDVTVAYPRRPVADPVDAINSVVAFNRPHEFGDTRYRRVTYTALATTRFRDDLPAAIASQPEQISRLSQPAVLDILSSARPAAPHVLYVIPTFGWERRTERGMTESRRHGSGLRAYLDRPWFSSGDGERLGVVLWTKRRRRRRQVLPVAIPDSFRPYVTRWGADPLNNSVVAAQSPLPADFTLADAREGDLTLEEITGEHVSVAGHPVGWDAERQLWYCDIEIDPRGAFWPFVRLALARYQPHSVKGPGGDVKLSRVVLADFAQLLPDRSVSITRDARDPQRFRVAVAGPRAGGHASRRIEVSVERYRPEIGGTLGWVLQSDARIEQPSRSDLLWYGEVLLPGQGDDQARRIMVKEFESLPADPIGSRTEERLVFADAIEI